MLRFRSSLKSRTLLNLLKPLGRLRANNGLGFKFLSTAENQNVVPTVKNTEKSEAPKARILEKALGNPATKSFQAETREILNIVTHSIYTNKEIFLRELISNASDAVEQYRYLMQKNPEKFSDKSEMAIRITVDKEQSLLIVQDNGMGMSEEQAVSNLGTIAKSGSKSFMSSLADKDAASAIIGKFGVGFYSAFMVAPFVEVFSRSREDAPAVYWASYGKGDFVVSAADNVDYGTKIILKLDDQCKEFADPAVIEKIIKRYSSYIKFPIFLNEKRVNLLGALWRESPKAVPRERHVEFYKNLTNAYDPFLLHFHFHKDFPLAVQALLYVPKQHSEKFGQARMKPAVDIYARHVLIQKGSPDVLPSWLRFVAGIVESETLSLSLSREHTQNSDATARLRRALVKSLLAELRALARRDPPRYAEFYAEYALFLKEGVCSDETAAEALAPLLRFDSSRAAAGELRGLDDYVGAMAAEQKQVYYLVTGSRELALRSPYYEGLRKAGREVLFLYSPVDEFVMSSLGSYEKRKLVSIETQEVSAEDMAKFDGEKSEFELTEAQTEDLCDWLKDVLGDRVKSVKPSRRLRKWPAIVVGHENSSMALMMQMASNAPQAPQRPQLLEVNPAHEAVRGLFYAMRDDAELARLVAQQLLDNALIEAGLLSDPREMLERTTAIMAAALDVGGIEAELRARRVGIAAKAAKARLGEGAAGAKSK